MISSAKSRRVKSVIGLAFERGRIEGVVLRRNGGALQIQQSFQAPLTLDPLTNDPELVGREILNHLNAARVREKTCVISVPANWAHSLQVKLPPLPPDEVDSFLSVQAERGFPYAPEDLIVSSSIFKTPSGDQYATVVGIPKNHVATLSKVLQAAKLKPVSFTLGIAALRKSGEGSGSGAVVIAVSDGSVDMLIACGGGVAALRALEDTFETEGGRQRIYTDLVSREVKITLGQLPKDLRDTVQRVEVYGRGEVAERLAREVMPRLEAMGLSTEWVNEYRTGESALGLPAHTPASPAVSVAARYLAGVTTSFEFSLPKVSAWPQFASRFASRRMAAPAAVAGVLLLLVGGAFLVQGWKLSNLESQWRTMEPRVLVLEDLQQQIRKYRPWFDNSPRSLIVFRRLTEAFPQDGAVSAKTLEIRGSVVTCSGVAKDNPSLRKVLDQLRASKEVSNITVDQLRGTAPLQFSFNFQWQEGQ